MAFKDYYKIMGISQQATPDEIQHSFRKLARQFHPDVSTEPNATDRFKEIREAYEVFRHDGVLPASYEVIYGHAWVPDTGKMAGNRDVEVIFKC